MGLRISPLQTKSTFSSFNVCSGKEAGCIPKSSVVVYRFRLGERNVGYGHKRDEKEEYYKSHILDCSIHLAFAINVLNIELPNTFRVQTLVGDC